jgi:capsular polysaccharide biosynthesis protein
VEIREAVEILLRRWWLVVALPLAVLTASLALTADPPYVATVRATILIPGDTEVPGSAERPELMVLDDAPTLVESRVFAQAVSARLRSVAPGLGLGVDDVRAALSASRHSRVLTAEARHEQEREALAIAVGVAAALPDAVNQNLVAANAPPATVRIIDPPDRAVRDHGDRALIVALQTGVALVVGVGLAFLAASLDDRLYSAAQVEAALGLPVLAETHASRRGWAGTFGLRRPPWLRR